MLLSIAFIAASVIYGLWSTVNAGAVPQVAVTPPTSTPAANPDSSAGAPTTSQNSSSKAVPKHTGQYVDGTYTGTPANSFYGVVQVAATVSGGRLTNVQFLRYPNDRGTSREISSFAMPQLTSEAIQAQNANVDIVSGASDTSQAFIESLGSALAQAKA